MSYNIIKTDGTPLYGQEGLPENTTASIIYNDVDESDSSVKGHGLTMIGKLIPDYGAYQSDNFVHLAENFATRGINNRPDNPLLGMIWYNIDDNCLYVCNDESNSEDSWTKLMKINFNLNNIEQAAGGDLYYNKEEKKLYIYDDSIGTNGDWVAIGPANFFGKETESADLTTTYESQSSQKDINLNANTTNLITIKAVARENMVSNVYGNTSLPETSAWIVRMVVNSYDTGTEKNIRFIGDYNVERIATTKGVAKDWNIVPTIVEGTLIINVIGVPSYQGTTQEVTPSIHWQLDIEIVKA